MRWWSKLTNSRQVLVALAIVLLAGLMVAYWWDDIRVSLGQRSFTSASGILILADCDPNYRIPPFHDTVTLINPNGHRVSKIKDLNICETVGGHRALSVAPDGRFFLVCENVEQKLAAYQIGTGKSLWSIRSRFDAAAIAPHGMIYALRGDGTIDGKQLVMINANGRIIKQAPVGGYDLALDAERKVLWVVGKQIKKCDLELNVVQELEPVKWCAVSVDLAPDGSIWVAERQHPNVSGSQDRILKIGPDGQLLKAVNLPWEPFCLRVDRSDGSLWVTGMKLHSPKATPWLDAIEKRTGRLPLGQRIRDLLTRSRAEGQTAKYDQRGTLLHELSQGGHTLDVNQADGSLWVAGWNKIYHYSCQGKPLGQYTSSAASQKYIAVIPSKAGEVRRR